MTDQAADCPGNILLGIIPMPIKGGYLIVNEKSQVLSGRIVAVPTENLIRRFFTRNFKLRKKRSQVLSTRYAEQDAYEFFAEQFSLFAMGKMDKVTPQFMELIREIADERTI